MLHTGHNGARTLGADLRALRRARGITLAKLAEDLGRSVGWMSQVERDLSKPSISELRQISALLDVPVSILFGQPQTPAQEFGYVVRKGQRRQIGSSQEGLIEELLSPDLTDDFEVVHSTFRPNSALPEPVTRPTQEVGFILSGKLDLWIDGKTFNLTTGDSFRIRGEPFRWMNPYDNQCVAIWVIAPPVY